MTYYPIISSSRMSKGYGYEAGGQIAEFLWNATVEKYDDVLNAWNPKTSMNNARFGVGAFSLNEYGYCCGGSGEYKTDAVEKYDNITNTWISKASLNTARAHLAGFSLNDYGYTAGGDAAAISAVVEKYNDILNTWTVKTSLNTAAMSSGFSLNSYAYSYNGTYAEKYDDISNTWTITPSVSTPVSDGNSFSLNGYGYSACDGKTYKYDDINNTWTGKTDTINATYRPTGFSLNAYGYSVTGRVADATNYVEKYDDILNTWTNKQGTNIAKQNRPGGFSLGNLPQSIQNPDIQEIVEANRRLRANEAMVTKAASANARNTHNAVVTTTSATYTKKKTITFNLGLIGGYRVLFDLKTSDIAKTAYGRVYRNGVALGTEQTEAGLAYATKSEDLTTSLSPGDTLELWLHNDGVGTTSAQNFQIAYDDAPTVAVQSSNS